MNTLINGLCLGGIKFRRYVNYEDDLLMKIDNCVEGVLDYVSDHAVKNAIISNKSEVDA